MENTETDWKRYKGPFHWFHWSMDKFIPKITAMLAMLQWSEPRILGWNETSEKNVHWSTLRLPHRPQQVVSKSKFWKHIHCLIICNKHNFTIIYIIYWTTFPTEIPASEKSTQSSHLACTRWFCQQRCRPVLREQISPTQGSKQLPDPKTLEYLEWS